ncbi:MAG: HD domain-containing protein [Candidatus Lokiarchaeota archaeon]|nr:HD domain-containing protein [Candidatus Lokiarchaeota archaeon]
MPKKQSGREKSTTSHGFVADQPVDVETVKLVRVTGMRESELVDARKKKDKIWKQIQRIQSDHSKLLSKTEAHSRQKAIQDPVHGAIIFDPWELDLVSGWEILRLRFVKQLGPAHIVYPGATHTRFQHCLGTNFLAQKCVRVVNYCDDLDNVCFSPLSQLLDDYQQKVFRAAALLHDVGHPPTSHTIEFALESWSGLDHTDLGAFLILNSGVTEILERHDIEPKTVVDVLKRRSKDPVLMLLSDFIDSPLDIDKTDYLIRDAHFSGVQLGVFPAERVLLTNRVVRDGRGKYHRAFMLKALHSLEALTLSRNWMFASLYLHHAVRVAESLVSKATYFRMKEEELTKNECIGLFTRMTDSDLYAWLKESETDFIREYAARIRYRRLFKVVLSRPLLSFEDDTRNLFMKMLSDIETLIDNEVELGDDIGKVIIDVVNPELGEKSLGRIPLLVGGEKSGIEIVRLKKAQEGKPIIHALRQQKRTIPSVRVYSDPEIAGEIRDRFNKMYPLKRKARYRQDEYDMTET